MPLIAQPVIESSTPKFIIQPPAPISLSSNRQLSNTGCTKSFLAAHWFNIIIFFCFSLSSTRNIGPLNFRYVHIAVVVSQVARTEQLTVQRIFQRFFICFEMTRKFSYSINCLSIPQPQQLQLYLFNKHSYKILQLPKMHEKLRTDQLISHHRVRQDYQESPANTLQFAYGDHRYTKFTYELQHESDILKQKILNQLVQDFSLCNNVDLCLKSCDLISVLFRHLKNQDVEIRRLATLCIGKICASPFGRKQIIVKSLIQSYEEMIHDSEKSIRLASTKGLINFAQFTEGVDILLESKKILKNLVDKLISQKNEQVLNNVIKLLKMMMQGQAGTPKALETEIISRLVNLIDHPLEKIRYNVCMTLANISFNEKGKAQIVGKKFIKNIIPKLQDKDPLVREASCLLLCSLAQLNQGKIEILDQANFDSIIKLLDDQPATVLNAVQLITSLAQNPKGRLLAEKNLDKISGLKNIEKIYVDAAIDVIKWKP